MIHNIIFFDTAQQEKPMTPAIMSSVLMAVAGMGDALLYAYLPVEGDALGLSVITIGILLSINKFIRLFTNRWIAWLALKWKIKSLLLVSVIFSAVTTFSYALNPAVWVWVLSRLIWGFSYSALRFSTIQYAAYAEKTGSALGWGRSIQEIGPVLAYWLGPLLISQYSVGCTFKLMSLAIILILPLFLMIPDYSPGRNAQIMKPFTFQIPGSAGIWVFITSFFSEGVLIVGVSQLLKLNIDQEQLLVWAAVYISIRRVAGVIISPVTGWLHEKVGFKSLFNFSGMLIISGLLIIGSGLSAIGIIIVFLGFSMNSTIVPLIALRHKIKENQFEVLTQISTARDMGSAIGSLVALNLLSMLNDQWLFGITTFILMIVWFSLRKLN